MNGLEKLGVIGAVGCTALAIVGFNGLSAPEDHPFAATGPCIAIGSIGVLVFLLIFAIGRMVGDGPQKNKAAKAMADAAEMQSLRSKVKSMNMD